MKHLAFFFYILSFTTGCVAIGISMLIYSQFRKAVILTYALLLTSLTLILGGLILLRYRDIVALAHADAVSLAALMIDTIGVALCIYSTPLVFHHLLARKIVPFKRGIFGILAGLFLLTAVLRNFLSLGPAATVVGFGCFFGTLGYAFLLIAFNLKRVGGKDLKKALGFLVILNLIFFPLFMIEALRENIPYLRAFQLFELFTLPVYFLLLNTLSIVFAIRYFNRPPFLQNNTLTDFFRNRFGITKREAEIIELLIYGSTYNDIGAKLYISYKTVDNHIRHIYQKTEVRNRLQLLNLIQSNRL